VLVAIAGTPESIQLIERRRIELVSGKTPRQPYHAAQGLELKQAEKLISQCIEQATMLAHTALADALRKIEGAGYQVVGAGVIAASTRPLPSLARILASHALIHSAEGELFRSVLCQTCEKYRFPVLRAKERDLYSTAGVPLGISPDAIQSRLSEIGRAAGPPWRQDEKLAALIAWLALAAASKKTPSASIA
jgi:hypothetical protein